MLGKIKDLLKIVLTVRNAPAVASAFVSKKDVVVRFWNGQTAEVRAGGPVALMDYVNFFRAFPSARIKGTIADIPYEGKRLQMDFGWLGPVVLIENFTEAHNIYGKYLKGIDLHGRTVVDVGAAFGDSTIWFALMGARTVVSIEPLPSFAVLVRQNIKLNGLEQQCVFIHAGVSSVEEANISEDKSFGIVLGGYDPLAKEFKGAPPVPTVTLAELIRTYGIEDGILKLDCEGWEYDIVLQAANEVLRRFEYIVMEYHYGYERLEAKFAAAGFGTVHTEPVTVHVAERPKDHQDMAMGYIFATRRSL